MPVIVVPMSAATVAIETFMTELSRVIRNCPEASTASTRPEPVRIRFCTWSVMAISLSSAGGA
jgi:hypothetical protein